MSQTPPTFSTTHCTASLMRSAIVLDLSDALCMYAEVPDAHMTILFRRGGYNAADLAAVQRAINQWLADSETPPNGVLFQLSQWGQKSDYIHGPLCDLCTQVRTQLHLLHDAKDARAPHVATR